MRFRSVLLLALVSITFASISVASCAVPANDEGAADSITTPVASITPKALIFSQTPTKPAAPAREPLVPEGHSLGASDQGAIAGRADDGGAAQSLSLIEQQLPDFSSSFPGLYTIKDATAVKYLSKLAEFVARNDPEMKVDVDLAVDAVNCAISSGLVAARVYLPQNLGSASAFILATFPSAQNLTQAILSCVTAHVTNGGPGGNGAPDFAPCFGSFNFLVDYPSTGQIVKYYAFILATDSTSRSTEDAPNCATMQNAKTAEGYQLQDIVYG